MTPVQKLCRGCGCSILVWNTVTNKCPACIKKTAKPPKQRKPIPKKGKRAKLYDVWRDTMAIPYLDNKYGIACAKCKVLPAKKDDGTYYRHDVAHIQNRGSHPQFKMLVTNVRYLCRDCHQKETDGKEGK